MKGGGASGRHMVDLKFEHRPPLALGPDFGYTITIVRCFVRVARGENFTWTPHCLKLESTLRVQISVKAAQSQSSSNFLHNVKT